MVVKCDVWPDIDWKSEGQEKPYFGLKGKYKRKPFNQERFDSALRDLTERYARLEPFEDDSAPLQNGDACVVNMAGYLAVNGEKGEALPEGVASGDNVEVVLGEGRYMEGLVEGLVGGKVGETKEVKVRFPDVSISCHVCVSYLMYLHENSRYLSAALSNLILVIYCNNMQFLMQSL